MSSPLSTLLVERIRAGLERKSVTSASRWAEKYRVMGQPFPGYWSFLHHPWLRGMHDSKAELNVGRKAAQMGYTETVLNLTFYKMDVEGVDCLYVLPAKTPDASDFSAARFDPALEMSPHLAKMFSDVKNVGHKRAGINNLYIRGSRSRAGLKSVPVAFIVLDEVDEMNQENIPLALERAAGQQHWQAWEISTPRIDNFGIDKQYQNTTKEHFFFPCPHCGKNIELTFPDNLVITAEDANDPKIRDSYLICNLCKGILKHEEKPLFLANGIWVPEVAHYNRGFQVNQLYGVRHPYHIAIAAIQAKTDPAVEQELYNSKLGLPHVVDGARVSDKEIDTAISEHRSDAAPTHTKIRTLGVDVGKYLHYIITEWSIPSNAGANNFNILATKKVVAFGKLMQFEELDHLMFYHKIRFAVVDANPERRKALEFAGRFDGLVRLCFYGNSVNGREIHLSKEDPTVTVDRTSWLDLTLGRFHNASIKLPCDTTHELKEHVKALVRIYEKDATGNPVGRYINSGDDHYAHALNYDEIAFVLGFAIGKSHNIRNSPL